MSKDSGYSIGTISVMASEMNTALSNDTGLTFVENKDVLSIQPQELPGEDAYNKRMLQILADGAITITNIDKYEFKKQQNGRNKFQTACDAANEMARAIAAKNETAIDVLGKLGLETNFAPHPHNHNQQVPYLLTSIPVEETDRAPMKQMLEALKQEGAIEFTEGKINIALATKLDGFYIHVKNLEKLKSLYESARDAIDSDRPMPTGGAGAVGEAAPLLEAHEKGMQF